MWRRILLLFIAAVGALAPVAIAAEDKATILDLGGYDGDLPRHAAGEWLALCPAATGVELKRVQVKITAYRSSMLDDGPNQKTGRQVETPGCPQAHALLRLRGLRAGPLATAVERDGKLVLSGGEYVARAEGVPEPEDRNCDGQDTIAFVLSLGDRRQVLERSDGCGDFKVRWAGDLDGDGKLDLLLDEKLSSGATMLHLYLSRGAGSELVREAARVVHGGC